MNGREKKRLQKEEEEEEKRLTRINLENVEKTTIQLLICISVWGYMCKFK